MAKAPGYMVAAAVLWAAAASGAGLATVVQRGRAFTMPSVQIARGDTVRFVNEDTFLHQIFVQSANFDYESDEQSPGQTVDVRFTSAGTFMVHCHIHPKMALQVDVR